MKGYRSLVPACSLVFTLALPLPSSAQWAKTFTSPGADIAAFMEPSPGENGDYTLSGSIAADSTDKAFIAKLNASGVFQWGKTVTSTRANLGTVELADGSFFVAGLKDLSTDPDSPLHDIVWAKYTSTWNPVYQKKFGGPRDDVSSFGSVSSDGGFTAVGNSNSYGASAADYDILVMKIDSGGNLQWAKAIDHGAHDEGAQIVELADGGYAVIAEVASATGTDILLVKLNASGAIVWKKLVSRTGVNTASAIHQASNGDLILMGTTQTTTTSLASDLLLMRFNSAGALLWQKTYGTATQTDKVTGANLIENPDGTFILSGGVTQMQMTPPYGFSSKILLLKLSSLGAVLTQKTLTDGKTDMASVMTSAEGDLLLSGTSMTLSPLNTNVLYGKINPATLTPVWVMTFGGTGSDIGTVMQTGTTYFLTGITDSFPAGGPTKSFGITLDTNGTYPNCTPINGVTLTAGTAGITATLSAFTVSVPALTIRTTGQATNTTLTVAAQTVTEGPICEGIADPPAAPPRGVQATSTSAGAVTIKWNAAAGANSYKVFRKVGTAAATTLATPAGFSYRDATAAGNTATKTYSYYVQACNSAGCSASSKVATVPFKPTAMNATTPSAGAARLSWQDNSANETGFEVFQNTGTCTVPTGSWQKITSPAAGSGTGTTKVYTLNSLTTGSTYSYKVRSYTKSALTPYAYGYSLYSNCVSVTVK